MNANNNNNPAMNVDDYENMAVNNSNTAKRMAAGAAILVGGAAVAGGAAYAASTHDEPVVEDPMTPDTLLDGAEAAAEYEASEPAPAQTTTVYVTQPAPAPEPEPEPEVVWEETTNYYVDGEKFASVEEGRVDGTKFSITDIDNDGRADFFGYDANHNEVIEDHEVRQLAPNEYISMGNPTAHETNNNVILPEGEDVVDPFDPNQGNVAHNEMIRNNFEDEKTGESYRNDYAENNPDYNPDSNPAQDEPRYMASMEEPQSGDTYAAGMPETEPEPEPEPEPDYMADIHNDADDFGGEECLV